MAVVSFDEFFRDNYRDVVGLAASLCGRRNVAEELAQEAFFRAHLRWDRVANLEAPEAWIRRVVVNLAVSSFRKATAEARAMARVWFRDGRGGRELVTSDSEFWRAVRSLPRRQAQCIALRYLEDRTIEQIAEILVLDAATVRVHLHRGRRTLADRLGTAVKEDDG